MARQPAWAAYGVAMVTHGDTIRAALTWLGQQEECRRHRPGNGSVTSVSVEVGQDGQPVAQRLSR